ncbi:hypothetical protein BLNAU_10647 [Blattamonas nauphoetae]|uniref:Uncharacterized protein n=1 Tax=Blattamonas nauphoetae TaxID=2049346 RepID=A0ABQ9XS75_9EUKA|nr:hypothetical protein BLNAU_10647 [Blattamonas nauphoetae]
MESREQQTSGDIPPPIAWHAGQIWDKNMFIVGGVSLQTSETISTDDLFVLDLETLVWQFVNTEGSQSSSHYLHPAVENGPLCAVAADTTIVLTREMPARGQAIQPDSTIVTVQPIQGLRILTQAYLEENKHSMVSLAFSCGRCSLIFRTVVVQPTLSILLSDRTQDKARLKKYWPEWVWETEYQETKKHDTRTQSTLHSFLTLPTLTVKVECEYV